MQTLLLRAPLRLSIPARWSTTQDAGTIERETRGRQLTLHGDLAGYEISTDTARQDMAVIHFFLTESY